MKAVLFVCAFLILAGCLSTSTSPRGGEIARNLRLRYSPSGQISLGSTQGVSLYNQNLAPAGSFGGINCYQMGDFVWSDNSTVVSDYEKEYSCNGSDFLLTIWNNGVIEANTSMSINQFSDDVPALALSNDSRFLALSFSNSNNAQDINNLTIGYGFYIINMDNLSVIRNFSTYDLPITKFSPDGRYLGVLVYDRLFGADSTMTIYSIPGFDQLGNFSDYRADNFEWINDSDMLMLYGSSPDSPWTSSVISLDPFNQSAPAKTLYSFDCEAIFGYDCSLDQIEASPDGRYVAVGGTLSESACPESAGPQVCVGGFIAVIDLDNRTLVFSDQGGEATDNTDLFDWSPDGTKLAYSFDGRNIFVKKISG